MEKNLEVTLLWLQEKVNLDVAGPSKLVEESAPFFGLSLESHKEMVAWPLQKRL
jgi:hypothetical protein